MIFVFTAIKASKYYESESTTKEEITNWVKNELQAEIMKLEGYDEELKEVILQLLRLSTKNKRNRVNLLKLESALKNQINKYYQKLVSRDVSTLQNFFDQLKDMTEIGGGVKCKK